MKNKCCIYGLVHPLTRELRYVGYTKHAPEVRLSAHLTEARSIKSKRTYKNQWVRSLLSKGLQPEIIVFEWTDNPHEAERRWIAQKRAEGCRLANGTSGGRGCLGARWKLTKTQREAISNRAYNINYRIKKAELRVMNFKSRILRRLLLDLKRGRFLVSLKPPRKPNLGHTGYRHSEEQKRLWSKKRRGVKWSPEIVAKRAAALKGHFTSDETKEKIKQSALARWALRRAGGGFHIGRTKRT